MGKPDAICVAQHCVALTSFVYGAGVFSRNPGRVAKRCAGSLLVGNSLGTALDCDLMLGAVSLTAAVRVTIMLKPSVTGGRREPDVAFDIEPFSGRSMQGDRAGVY